MFRLELFVDDKKLSYVLWALAGNVIEMSPPQPVRNVKKTANGLAQESNGNKLAEQFEHHLDREQPPFVNVPYVKAFLEKNGTSPQSASYVLRQLVDMKRLRKLPGAKTGSAVKYKLLPRVRTKRR